MNISVRIILTSFASVALNFCAQAAQTLDGAKIDQLTGLKGKMNDVDGVYKVSQPRNDIKVTVDGLQMPPFMGLTSWAAFVSGKTKEAMVMGDLVLMQDEVNPVMSAALESGLEVSGLHNHFFYDEPKVYFMHIGGHGQPEELAAAVKGVWDAIKAVRAAHKTPGDGFDGGSPESGSVDAAAVEAILGQKGQVQDGVLKVTIGREGTMHGVKVGGSM